MIDEHSVDHAPISVSRPNTASTHDMDDDYVEAGVADDVETENVVTRDFTREQKTAVDK